MNKRILLPKLAFMGIRKNSTTYLPYMIACVFSMFTYFVFDSILYNDIMEKLPRASYVWMLMWIGFILLGIIFIPFLFYTNSFLIKRRKKELGLYSILGLEKKHIGLMMLLETVYIYGLVLLIGIITGVIFSKLVFLLLLNMTGLPVETAFTFQWQAVKDSALFFGFISLLNLGVNLFQVGKANPTELMRGSRKGEKEPRRIWILAVLGAALLAWGYGIAVTAQIDSMIFINFFLAIFLVILGTYFLFTSGSIAVLRMLKKNKKYYYLKENFITVSGMQYRMKKSAASLANICIFATMVIITLLCTASLYTGMEGIFRMTDFYDVQVQYLDNQFTGREDWQQDVRQLANENQVTIDTMFSYRFIDVSLEQKEELFTAHSDKTYAYEDKYPVYIIPLAEFNRAEGADHRLEEGEILIYSTGEDYGYDRIILENEEYRVKEELQDTRLRKKARANVFNKRYLIVVKDEPTLLSLCGQWGYNKENIIFHTSLSLSGEDKDVEAFIRQMNEWSTGNAGFFKFDNGYEGKKETFSMSGGLLFLGVFFSIIFMMCMVLIMYYKQITEGFEDKNNFAIMRKVGMSDQEVKATIRKQIFMVFFLPLIGAAMHTAAGIPMIMKLLSTINLFDGTLILLCSLAVIIAFGILYVCSYLMTARTYYKIVHEMA